MSRIVDRLGRTGFAAVTSLAWFLPMAAWAGSADLSPIDKTAYPWVALAVGLVMLAAWIALLTRLGRVPITNRQRRLDFKQMTTGERRWNIACFAFACGIVAWLNAAATVDWEPLSRAVVAGKLGPVLFAAALVGFLLVVLAGTWASWRRATAAFRSRVLTFVR
jgi:hypothetical protein